MKALIKYIVVTIAYLPCIPGRATAHAIPLLNNVRLEAASLSPNGKQVAYQTSEVLLSRDKVEVGEIRDVMYVRDASLRAHVKAIGSGFRPIWSPINDDIAFIWQNSLWVSRADGSQRHVVYEGTPPGTGASSDSGDRMGCRRVSRIAWSPDAQQIAFVLAGCYFKDSQSLWITARSGQDARILADGLGDVPSLTWSPDGKRIAFNENIEGRDGLPRTSYIKVVDPDGSRLSTLVSDTFEKLGPIDEVAFAPDGKLVAAGLEKAQNQTLWEILPNGTPRTFLTTKEIEALGVRIEGGSIKLAFARQAPRMLLGRFHGHGQYDLWVVDLPRRLVDLRAPQSR